MFKLERDGAVVYNRYSEYLIVEPAPVNGYNFFYLAPDESRVGWAPDFDPRDFCHYSHMLKVLLDRHCDTTEAMVADARLLRMIESAHDEDFDFKVRFKLGPY